MSWRLAQSLVVLRNEVWTISPGQVIGTIGDAAHASTWSDHNPNECCDVVCAADIMPGRGLDLDLVAARIVATDPPALKYVIWHDRIWFPGYGWAPYSGEYHTHVHVSVGRGPDGRSSGPYDDTSPWGLLPAPAPTQEEDMSVKLIAPTDGWGKGGVYKLYPTDLGMALEHLPSQLAQAVELYGREVYVSDARAFGTPIEELRSQWAALLAGGSDPDHTHTVAGETGPARQG